MRCSDPFFHDFITLEHRFFGEGCIHFFGSCEPILGCFLKDAHIQKLAKVVLIVDFCLLG